MFPASLARTSSRRRFSRCKDRKFTCRSGIESSPKVVCREKPMSAFGGKADISRSPAMSAFDSRHGRLGIAALQTDLLNPISSVTGELQRSYRATNRSMGAERGLAARPGAARLPSIQRNP
jgi:hypothetical protein